MDANTTVSWQVAGIYFEGCNCESICPCWSGGAPTDGYCEGVCAWHVERGRYGDVPLDGLSVAMVQRADGPMRETRWKCWYYIDERATEEQFAALTQIFTAAAGGSIGAFRDLWDMQRVERAPIEINSTGWQHRLSIPRRLGLAIGLLKPEAGPQFCRIPAIHGIAALAEEDWADDGPIRFDYAGKNALSTTFQYSN